MWQVCHLNFYMQRSTSQHPPLPLILYHRPLDLPRVSANKSTFKEEWNKTASVGRDVGVTVFTGTQHMLDLLQFGHYLTYHQVQH